MAEYAIVDNGAFVEFRNFDDPPELAGKPYRQILPVVREYGEPGEGVEDGSYVVRTVDPATLPVPVPAHITPLQARKALREAGYKAAVDQYVAGLSEAEQEEWEYATAIYRDNPIIAAGATALGLTDDQVDDLFRLGDTL